MLKHKNKKIKRKNEIKEWVPSIDSLYHDPKLPWSLEGPIQLNLTSNINVKQKSPIILVLGSMV